MKAQNDVYLDEWRAVARSICESNAPDMALQKILRSLVERLQQQEINLTSEKIQLESQLKTTTLVCFVLFFSCTILLI